MDEIVGRRVHHLMWDQKITQTQLGARLGLQQSALSRKLRGDRGWSLDEIVVVAKALNTTVAELLREDARVTPTPPDDDLDEGCAARESNPQPADSTVALVRHLFPHQTDDSIATWETAADAA